MDFRTRYFCAQNNNVIMDLGYNLFKQEQKPFVKQPDLTVPKVYDPSKDVADNLAGKGNPIGADVAAHYRALAPKQPSTTPTTTLNVDPNSDTAGADAISKLFTPPEEEERKRRASIANQRIAAVGDALRNIGNIYYATKGAPAQKFNNPVKEEEERYQKEKAIRDRNNQYYMTYQRAKEKQNALAAYNEQMLDYRRDNLELKERIALQNDLYRAEKLAQDKAYKDAIIDIRSRVAEGQISVAQAREALLRVQTAAGGWKPSSKSSSGGGGNGRKGGSGGNGETTTTTTTVVDDGKGNKKTTTKTTVKKKGASGKKTLPQGKNTTKKTTKKQLP